MPKNIYIFLLYIIKIIIEVYYMFNNKIKAVVIADTHNTLLQREVNKLFSYPVDLVIILGDIGEHDWEVLLNSQKFCEMTKLAVAGNHDTEQMYININKRLEYSFDPILAAGDDPRIMKKYKPIVLLNPGKDDISIPVYIVKDIIFAGISGSVKYKNIDSPFLKTQRQALDEIKNIPAADILLSHDKPKREFDNSDNIQTHMHYGLYAIWQYMQKYNAVNMHGHVHQEYANGREYSYYRTQYVEIKRRLLSGKIAIKVL